MQMQVGNVVWPNQPSAIGKFSQGDSVAFYGTRKLQSDFNFKSSRHFQEMDIKLSSGTGHQMWKCFSLQIFSSEYTYFLLKIIQCANIFLSSLHLNNEFLRQSWPWALLDSDTTEIAARITITQVFDAIAQIRITQIHNYTTQIHTVLALSTPWYQRDHRHKHLKTQV